MRRLAASGQTIICTIHQPSAALFEAFDVLILLAKGGRTTYFGETGRDSAILLDYFARHRAPCPQDANPAEHIVDVIQGRQSDGTDWPQEWIASPEYQHMMNELHQINQDQAKGATATTIEDEDTADFASPIKYQIILVTKRRLIALWRNPDYIWNKIGVHVTNSLFAGFTFWKLGDGTHDLQFRMMSVFNFVFVAPGCINQLQPLFIQNRDIFESREKKSKTYHWLAFVSAQVISEIPVLIVCATLFFVSWYFSSGFPVKASASGQVYLQMIFYEFLYTSIGQAIAAYSPNAYFAALANPIIIGAFLINFCGVVVPYAQIQAFWRYWVSQNHTSLSCHFGHPADTIIYRCTTSTPSPTSSAAFSSPSSTTSESSADQTSSHKFPCLLAQHAGSTWPTSSALMPVISPIRITALRASTARIPRVQITSGR
jgi:hypothetical protein